MKITNTRILHSVENENAFLSLRGEVQFSEERIVSFSGQFYKNNENATEGEPVNVYSGDFYFSENEQGNTVNKSINSIPTELHTHGCDLLEATVEALHEYGKELSTEE
jgi:hypothetical protein